MEQVPRTLVPEKMIKDSKNLKKMQMLYKIADIKSLKNIPLHLEDMQ